MKARLLASIFLAYLAICSVVNVRAQDTAGAATESQVAAGQSQDIDYGQWFEHARQIFLSRFRSPLLWSNLIALLMGAWVWLMLIREEHRGFLWRNLATKCATHYHNQLVDAREANDDLIARCHELEANATTPAMVSGQQAAKEAADLELVRLRTSNETLRQQNERLFKQLEEERQKNRRLKGE